MNGFCNDKVKILIVEDEYLVAEELKMHIELMGYKVCAVVSSGEESIDKAEEMEPDLVLMDIMLCALINGIEAALQIHSRFNIPIIFITAYADNTLIDKAKLAEPFGYILKPFKERELHANIKIALYKSQIEKEKIKKEKFEVMKTFISGLTHDFNNFLMAILGYISLAKDKLGNNLIALGLLNKAEKVSLDARDLIQKFIYFTPYVNLPKKKSSINNLISDICQQVVKESRYSVSYCLFHELWHPEINKFHIRHAISNVIINAKEAMPEGGTITIMTKNMKAGEIEKYYNIIVNNDNYIAIYITDEGKGIPKENLPKIFDPYFSTKERGTQKGMGLGLSIAYSIIKKHNGYIDVDTDKDLGTTFSIFIPSLEYKTF